MGSFCFFIAGKTFLKESFSPHPFQRTLKRGLIFCHYFVRSTVECSVFAQHQSGKFLVKFFSKNLRGFGASSPIITAFSFCQAFSLRLSCQRKSGVVDYMFFTIPPSCIRKPPPFTQGRLFVRLSPNNISSYNVIQKTFS